MAEALWERANATVSMAAKDTPHRHLNEPPDFRSLGVIEPVRAPVLWLWLWLCGCLCDGYVG